MMNQHCLTIFSIATLVLLSAATDAQHRQTIGKIERLDSAIDDLIPAGAKIEVLAKGFEWSEGPVWVPSEKCVLFSDIPNNKVHRWDETNGLSTYLDPAGYTGKNPRKGELGSNGLMLDDEGRLLLCQHGDRRIARMTSPVNQPKPEYETVADRFDGKRLNSPNDLAIHSSGAIYFTDPPYGLQKQMEDPTKEIPFQGVYRIDTDGSVQLLTDKLPRPNGIAFSPDEKTAYVAVSDFGQPAWFQFRVQEDGTFGESTVLLSALKQLEEKRKGLPDGLKVDEHGNLFATGPGGVFVISPEGKHLGTIMTTEATANCAFGDDGNSLYMTADMYLLRIRLSTKGNGF